jgi:hypothetical protein
MIQCTLRPVGKRACDLETSTRKRYGTYLQSWYWTVKGYSKKKWVVGVYIELDYESARSKVESDDEVVQKCIQFLNTPPQSKYGKNRKRKPLYGIFDPEPYSYTVIEREGKKCISARLVTNTKKSKAFWGEGPTL